MKLPVAFIDSFTSVPFKGNPTAVCTTSENLDSELMLSIASEINCPVTAFIKQITGDGSSYDIRYFTTMTEIPACGHATLAAAKTVLSAKQTSAVNFCTVEKINIKAISEGSNILMTYPAYVMEDFLVSPELLSSLHLTGFKTAGYCPQLETLFIEVDDPATLKNIQPDFSRLVESSDLIIEVVITSASDLSQFDYLLRSFCPWIGINEDPVTGSVHSVLANFWKKRIGKEVMKAYQASSRSGEVLIKAFDDHTEIGGQAVIVFQGELTI
jgi:PhzF family phenazine biosynthesis protein